MATRKTPRSAPRAQHGRIAIFLTVCAAHAAALAWLASVRAPLPPPAVAPPVVTGRLIPAPAAERPKPDRPTPSMPANPRPAVAPARASPRPLPAQPARQPPVAQPAAPGSSAQPPRNAGSLTAEPAPVSPPLANASSGDNPLPDYPALSRRLSEEGTVLLSVLILADGRVAEVSLSRSSGHPRLDAAAMAAVRRWHYRPARRGGEPIDYRYIQPVVFSLTD